MTPLDGLGGAATAPATGQADTSDAAVSPAVDGGEFLDDALGDATTDTSTVPRDAAGELPGLIGYWDFDVSAGQTLLDRSGHGHHGLAIGDPTRVSGVRGKALSFTGDFQRVEFSSLNGPNMPRSGTLSLWFNSAYTALTTNLLFGSWGRTAQVRVQIPENTTNIQAAFIVPLPDGGVATAFSVRPQMSADTWQHVVIVWDPDHAAGTVYVDGSRWTSPLTDPGWSPSQQDFTIGRNLRGNVDEVRLYDRPFEDKDIARIP